MEFLKYNSEHTGIWVDTKGNKRKHGFIKIQEWNDNFFLVIQGEVNLQSKFIDRKKTEEFANVSIKNKVEFIDAVLSFYGNDAFTQAVDFVLIEELENHIETLLKQKGHF